MKIAADSMGMPLKEFLKEIEKGNVEATNFAKVFSKAFGDFADPAFREAQKKTFFQFSKFMSEFDRFKISIFKSGLGDILSSMFTTLRHSIMLLTPVTEGFTKILSGGLHRGTAELRVLLALVLGVAEAFGLIDEESEKTTDSVAVQIGQWVVAIVVWVAKIKLAIMAWKLLNKVISRTPKPPVPTPQGETGSRGRQGGTPPGGQPPPRPRGTTGFEWRTGRGTNQRLGEMGREAVGDIRGAGGLRAWANSISKLLLTVAASELVVEAAKYFVGDRVKDFAGEGGLLPGTFMGPDALQQRADYINDLKNTGPEVVALREKHNGKVTIEILADENGLTNFIDARVVESDSSTDGNFAR